MQNKRYIWRGPRLLAVSALQHIWCGTACKCLACSLLKTVWLMYAVNTAGWDDRAWRKTSCILYCQNVQFQLLQRAGIWVKSRQLLFFFFSQLSSLPSHFPPAVFFKKLKSFPLPSSQLWDSNPWCQDNVSCMTDSEKNNMKKATGNLWSLTDWFCVVWGFFKLKYINWYLFFYSFSIDGDS